MPATTSASHTIRFICDHPGGSRRTFRTRWIVSAAPQFNCSFRAGPVGHEKWAIPGKSRNEAIMVRGIVGAVRALFAPRGGVKLSELPPTGGSRMARGIVRLAAVLALIGLGLSVYARFFYEPPLVEPPRRDDDGKPLPKTDEFEELAKTDPVAMYDACLKRFEREVRGGFRATLVKRERVNGEPKPPAEPQEEVIRQAVRGDVPDAETGQACIEVVMKWQSGEREALGSKIQGTLYSEKPGEAGTGGKVIVWRPSAPFASTMPSPIKGPLAESQSRYCIRDAGLYGGMHRTYEAWKQRKEAGTLTTKYLGKEVVEKAGGRLCYVIERTCKSPEVDAFERGGVADTSPSNVAKVGFTSVRVMIDAERWLQVGTELHRAGPDGKSILIASYYFRDVELNPTFGPDTFSEAGLKKK
jgi:hypothetical protein